MNKPIGRSEKDLRAQIKDQVHLDKYDDGNPIDLMGVLD